MKIACVCQSKKNMFTFSGLPKGQKTIYAILDPTDIKNKKELLQTTETEIELAINSVTTRTYFYIESKKASFVLAERTLVVDGMNNFRDMGGYRTVDGKHVKWGKLYRSDHLYNATEKGVEYLNTLHIHSIVDYRSDSEIEKYPNHVIAGDVTTYHLDPDAHTAELSAQFSSSKSNEDENLIAKIVEQKKNGTLVDRYDIVMKQYANFVNVEKSKQAFASMLKVAKDPNSAAIVQHCRGGKDRTGFGAMLLLAVLGVPKETLVYDYMLTNVNRIDRNNEKMMGYKKLTSDPEVLEYLYSLIDTKKAFIEKSIQSIEETYGNIKNYVMQELGLSKEDIIQLQTLYLE